jgi:hypothetical protein
LHVERKAILRQLGKRARSDARLALRMIWGDHSSIRNLQRSRLVGHPHSQRAWCSHVDSVMDDGRLLGARLDGGVQIRPPNYEKFSRVEHVVIPVPYYKERPYWDFLKAQIGKPYDKLAIVAFAVNRDWRSPDAWFRDELVAAGSNMLRWCASWRHASIVSIARPVFGRERDSSGE